MGNMQTPLSVTAFGDVETKDTFLLNIHLSRPGLQSVFADYYQAVPTQAMDPPRWREGLQSLAFPSERLTAP